MADEKPTFSLHDQTTQHGYNLMECMSAFQKCIRRSDVDGSLYWGAEIYRAGYGKYLWKRIFVILNEDVCPIENPGLAGDLWSLFDMMSHYKKEAGVKKAEVETLALGGAIIRMATATKSRVNVHAVIKHFSMPKDMRPIPDFALDRHTVTGRKLRRGWDHFFEEASALHGLDGERIASDPYEESVREWLDLGEPGKQQEDWRPGQPTVQNLFTK